MHLNFTFFINSIFFGIGLSMDAFSISLANGLNEPKMKSTKALGIAGVFTFFQAFMPLVGWFCIQTVLLLFQSFQKLIPWIALILLSFIGGKMLVEAFKSRDGQCEKKTLSFKMLLLQGIATSIDALSVGFTISDYNFLKALAESLIIAAVTFLFSIFGLQLGKRFGTKLSNKAEILGGIILIAIGIEIFISNII